MAGRAMKYVTSKPSKGLRRGNVGMRSIIATSTDPIGPTSATGYYNAINPRYPGKYVVYKVRNGDNLSIISKMFQPVLYVMH